MSEGELRGSRAPWGFVALAVAVVAEVVWYRELASFVSRIVLRAGDSGSSIDFYRDIYVFRGGLAFAAVVAIAFVLVRREYGGRRRFLLYGAWAANLLLLGLSLWFFFGTGARAEQYR